MSDIISPRKRIDVEKFELVFDLQPYDGSGFSFPCDRDGNVDQANLHPAGLANLEKCRAGLAHTGPGYIIDVSYTYYEPAQLRCTCRRIVCLEDAVVNTCDCGREYNGFGQQLAPRSQWGWDTGETVADILCGNAWDD